MERELKNWRAKSYAYKNRRRVSRRPKRRFPRLRSIPCSRKAQRGSRLLVAAVVGYASLNTRVSTCEYQNQISITDRADLRRRLDKSDDTLSEMKTDLGEIKVTLKQLADRRR